MRTPKAKSAICEQESSTPEIFQEITNCSIRGQDVASPQDTGSMQRMKVLKKRSAGHESFAESRGDTGDKMKKTATASERVASSSSVKDPMSQADGYKSVHAAWPSSSDSFADRKAFKDKYVMGKFISKALYGNIFSCVAKETSHNFACKVISNMRVHKRRDRNLCDDPTAEFQLLKLLADRPHRNLLSLVDHFADKRHNFFVLPLARGGDLLTSVQCHPAGLDIKLTREIFEQLALALQHLHTMGWQHGDVSLENILVISPGDFSSIKICDFGLASRMGSPGRSVGKLTYMAPEVLTATKKPKGEGKDTTWPSFLISAGQDVFSLGVCMFVTLCGFPPFESARDSDPNYRDLQSNLQAYRVKLTSWGVSPIKMKSPLLKLLMDMMSKDTEKRPNLNQILTCLKGL